MTTTQKLLRRKQITRDMNTLLARGNLHFFAMPTTLKQNDIGRDDGEYDVDDEVVVDDNGKKLCFHWCSRLV